MRMIANISRTEKPRCLLGNKHTTTKAGTGKAVMLLLVLAFCSVQATGQSLRLVTTEGKPAAMIRVALRAAGKKEQPTFVITDDRGIAPLPATGYPYKVQIAAINYEKTEDTISSAWNKTILLIPALQNLGTVVVTGQYAPNSAENAVQKIEVIDRKKIDAMGAQNLRDALANQLDIRLSQDPIFGVSMSMQGSKAYGEDAKILIDGVPVTGKQNGAVDLSQINLANIERIEIVKGPMSVSYGTDAIAGTINLITKKNTTHTLEAGANTYYESIGTYNVNAHAGVHKGRHSLTVDGSRNFFGGWNPGDDPSFFNFSKRPADTTRTTQWKPREQYSGTLQYIYTIRKTIINYKGTYFKETILNRGAPMLPYYEMAFDDYYHTFRKDNALFVNSALSGNKTINFLLAYNAYKRIKNSYTTDLTTLNETPTAGAQDTSKYSELNSRATFSSTNKDAAINYEVGYDINLQYANSTQLLDRKQQIGNYALFASAEYKPFSKLTIRPGLRYGYNTRYTAPLIPSLNFLYRPSARLSFRASYARGFRQPNLKELYFDFVDINHNIHGNQNLKAEYSDNYSASVNYAVTHNKVNYKLSGSGFRNNIEQLISLAAIAGSTTNEYTYVNIGKYKTHGAQANAEAGNKNITISAGGSYTGTYNQLNETLSVPLFSYSPEVRSSIMYAAPRYGITAALFYKYTGRFMTYIADTNGQPMQAFTASYNTADVTLSKLLFNKHVTITVGCKNLFDVKSITTTAGTGGVHSSSSGSTSISTGRYYFIKTDVNFHK